MNQGSGTEETLLRAFQRATRAYMAAHATELRLQQAYATRPTRAVRSSLDRATAVAQTSQLKLDTARGRYQAAENTPLPALTSLDRAESASSDKWSKLELLLFLGVLAGLVIGAGLATLLEVVSARVHTSDAIGETLGLELLARVPPPGKDLLGRDGLVMLQSPESLDAEAFRVLRMHLEFVSLESGARTFVFISALEDEGKTTTVCNLAVALALAGRRVVLVDGDVRQGAIAQALGLEGLPGLGDLVERSHRHALADVIAHVGVRGVLPGGGDGAVRVADVDVLPVGRLPKHPGEFAADPKVGRVLDELRVEYEFVLIDTPPLLVVGDAMAIAARSDAVIPIARLNYHSARDLNEFRRLLDAMPSEPIGFVLTGAAPRGARYRTYQPAQFQTRESVG
jgi:non-specific protein-tyrosine kinase